MLFIEIGHFTTIVFFTRMFSDFSLKAAMLHIVNSMDK